MSREGRATKARHVVSNELGAAQVGTNGRKEDRAMLVRVKAMVLGVAVALLVIAATAGSAQAVTLKKGQSAEYPLNPEVGVTVRVEGKSDETNRGLIILCLGGECKEEGFKIKWHENGFPVKKSGPAGADKIRFVVTKGRVEFWFSQP